MKLFNKSLIAAGFMALAGTAQAATFAGYEATTDVYFDGAADLFYDFGIGSIFDDATGGVLLSADFFDLGTGSDDGGVTVLDLVTFDEIRYDTLIDFMFTDNMSGDDELALLFGSNFGGVTDFAIGTFTGELGSDFLNSGAGVTGTFELVGAQSISAVPLPAGLPLILAGLGSLAWLRRKQA